MDRRLVGALVLVVAALAGNARTKQVAGDPVAAPVPGPPPAGACVLERPRPLVGDFGGVEYEGSDDMGSDVVGSDDVGAGEPVDTSFGSGISTATFGPCGSGERFGEVVEVMAGGLDYEPPEFDASDESAVSAPDPDDPWQRCEIAALRYLKAPYGAGSPPRTDRWLPTVAVYWDLIGPNPLQRAAGQRWLACVTVTYDAAGWTAGYTGSLAGAYEDLAIPSELAWCLSALPSAENGHSQVSCGERHAAELFATVNPTQDVPHPNGDLDGCRATVATMIGSADPTAGGRLKVVVAPVEEAAYFAPPGETSWSPELAPTPTTIQYCLVVPADPAEDLVGPLVGLGDRPVPLR